MSDHKKTDPRGRALAALLAAVDRAIAATRDAERARRELVRICGRRKKTEGACTRA